MNYSNDEILKAVKIIYDICNEQTTCSKCCFSDEIGNCLIHDYDTPCDWRIPQLTEVWKALF